MYSYLQVNHVASAQWIKSAESGGLVTAVEERGRSKGCAAIVAARYCGTEKVFSL